MEKLLVIGASGLLGSKIMVQARGRYDAIGTYNPEVDGADLWRLESLDVGSKDEVEQLFAEVAPNVVILTAAMTNVDACEKNPVVANRVNASGPALVARACKSAGARLVHVSTDYVFDGTKTRKYVETDYPRPISVYGSSKLAGEKSVLSALPSAVIARTAVLYGWNPIKGKENFVTWSLKKLRAGGKVTMFEDQQISPTFADDLAGSLLDLAGTDASGVYHVCGPDCLDRVACGKMIADIFNLDANLVISVKSNTLSLPAKRPAYSCLDISKVEQLLDRKMETFESSLRKMKSQESGKR